MRVILTILAAGFLILLGAMATGGFLLNRHYPKPTYLMGEFPAESYKITRVIDGDTVEIEVPFLPESLGKDLKVRIMGVDTPEKGSKAKCRIEDTKSQEAKAFTEAAIAKAKTVEVILDKWDKYGGRVLGDVILDGKRLSELLIDKGYAVEYHGEAKTTDWCKR